jgi:hypothetical protein
VPWWLEEAESENEDEPDEGEDLSAWPSAKSVGLMRIPEVPALM